jgi:hypothetical protein
MLKQKILISIPLVIALICYLYFCHTKAVVYIHFEKIENYSFEFIGKDTLCPENLLLKQSGKYWYQWWKFDLDSTRFEKIHSEKLKEIELVSQYWIIYNLNGFTIGFDYDKTKKYKLKIIRKIGDENWVYPVKRVHFLTE